MLQSGLSYSLSHVSAYFRVLTFLPEDRLCFSINGLKIWIQILNIDKTCAKLFFCCWPWLWLLVPTPNWRRSKESQFTLAKPVIGSTIVQMVSMLTSPMKNWISVRLLKSLLLCHALVDVGIQVEQPVYMLLIILTFECMSDLSMAQVWILIM